jgi:hypothetical protein
VGAAGGLRVAAGAAGRDESTGSAAFEKISESYERSSRSWTERGDKGDAGEGCARAWARL